MEEVSKGFKITNVANDYFKAKPCEENKSRDFWLNINIDKVCNLEMKSNLDKDMIVLEDLCNIRVSYAKKSILEIINSL